jgi:hypothetical protein
MITISGLALLALAIVLLTRAYVSFNPPDFLRQYKDADGNYCNRKSLPPHVLPAVLESCSRDGGGDRKEDNEGFRDKKDEEHDGNERLEQKQDQKQQMEQNIVQDESGVSIEQARSGWHTMHVDVGERIDSANTFAGRGELPILPYKTTSTENEWERSNQDHKPVIICHPKNPPQTAATTPIIPTPLPIPTLQPRCRRWLDLDISSIHYHGSLEPFGADPETLKTIQDLKTSTTHRRVVRMARTVGLTVVWENGEWCCLEGRMLYVLRAVGWTGQVRARVLVDHCGGEGAGASL